MRFDSEHALSVHHGREHEHSLRHVRMQQAEETLTCPTCGKLFDTHRGLKAHHAQAHGESISGFTQTCDWCDESFTSEKRTGAGTDFCSQTCYGEYRSEAISGEDNPSWHGGMVDVECEVCGEVFGEKPSVAPKRRFCSDKCMGEWRSENVYGEDHPLYEGGVFPYGQGWNERKKRQVRIRDQARCQHCGRTEAEHIDEFGTKHVVHHITPARQVDDPEERNAEGNLITLCRGSCHKTWEQMSPLRPDTAGTAD